MDKFLKINPADNVAVCTAGGAKAGDEIKVGELALRLASDIPPGHKVAVALIEEGAPVIKYGNVIGFAKQKIEPGQWVHSHNLRSGLGKNLEYEYAPLECEIPKSTTPITINAYLRSNGDMGIRNELWVIPTVGCVNGQANAIAERLRNECQLENVDDIRALTHNYGCSQLGQDHANTRAALAALIRHPNAGGVIVLGLGCENNQLARLKEEVGDFNPARVKWIVAQEVDDEVECGIQAGREILSEMQSDKRTRLPIGKLRVGLKCGGSDGLSGITANPLVGLFSDWLVAQGGTTVLTEVPEMFGAEQLLMNRATDADVFSKIVKLINDFKDYFRAAGEPVSENPSPGNKEGGITTLEEKSLGCVQKGGSAPVQDVLGYAEPLSKHGLNLLCAPGNDLVASTALALSGCQMVLFTTGRGTPFGTVVPTIKISTNSLLSERKPAWIDFNAGFMESDPAEALPALIDLVLSTANGKKAKHEICGAKEISIFKSGITL